MSAINDFIESIHPISASAQMGIDAIFTQRSGMNKGDFFCRSGEPSTTIGFLEQGIIRAFYRNSEGQEYNKHFFVGPCFIGAYSAMITGTTNRINQEAMSECIVWEASYSALLALYDQHHDLERMARKLAESFFVQKEQREIDIVQLDADERYTIFQKQYPTLEQQIPLYHIASYLGISATQLSRIRAKK